MLASQLVPTLHIRNVPVDVYDGLRKRAEREGRSLNAEVVKVLAEFVESEIRGEEWVRRLDELRREFLLPEDAPKPEDLIREARDERIRRLRR